MKRKMKMKWILSCLLALALAPSITPSVFAEEPVNGKIIYVDATNGNDAQEDVGTTSDKAYKTVEAAVAAAQSGDTIQLGMGNYTLYKVKSTGHTKDKDLTLVRKFPTQQISVQSTTVITALTARERLRSRT